MTKDLSKPLPPLHGFSYLRHHVASLLPEENRGTLLDCLPLEQGTQQGIQQEQGRHSHGEGAVQGFSIAVYAAILTGCVSTRQCPAGFMASLKLSENASQKQSSYKLNYRKRVVVSSDAMRVGNKLLGLYNCMD